MFEVGDKIVCINTGLTDGIFTDKSTCLTMYKTYVVVLKKQSYIYIYIN